MPAAPTDNCYLVVAEQAKFLEFLQPINTEKIDQSHYLQLPSTVARAVRTELSVSINSLFTTTLVISYFKKWRTEDSKVPLTEAEKNELKEELRKTEDEIATLRQVILARMKHASELKQKLGITAWQEIQQDFSDGMKMVKDSEAFHTTNDLLQQATGALGQMGSKVSTKLTQLRDSATFKSFEDKVGSAYSTVKSKVTGAIPSDAKSQPTTPNVENKFE
ncbi:Uncharacterized protein T08_15309 [Trichinella sp. T8]|nr:Uncharacterized protein T08_15309 [Trichinella sp. T8]